MPSTWRREVRKLEERRKRAHRQFVSSVDRARQRLDQEETLIDEALGRLDAMKSDFTVLIRTSVGDRRTVYHVDPRVHEGARACGHVTGHGRDLNRFERRLEGQVSTELRRCPYCTWPVREEQGSSRGLKRRSALTQ